jgi:hypothetical protein
VKSSSFDVAARSGTVRHDQAINQEEPVTRTSRMPGRSVVAGEATDAGVSGGALCSQERDSASGKKKRATDTSASDSLVGFVDHVRLIASIVRLIMSAWQAFGAHQQTRHRSCFRASAASR